MLSRRMFLASIVVAGALGPAAARAAIAAEERWARYRNARFGTTIAYPQSFQPGEEPENSDGRGFTTPEAQFRVFGRYNIRNETPETLLAALKDDAGHIGLTYQAIAGRRLTVSGWRGDRIFYEAYLFAPSGVVHSFLLEYPGMRKLDYDDVVTRMARSFGGP